ncbi:MAG: L,D-transpeptidase [Methylocystaceae bacterium]|nr:MAG: L,D-transpeptidase [Methylocystaceae bacterium]
MGSGGKSLWAANATFIVALGFFLAPAQAADLRAPFRAPLVQPPPPVVQQREATRLRVEPSDDGVFASPEEGFPLVRWTNSPTLVVLPDDSAFDVAEALITPDRRALADALDGWVGRAGDVERRKQRKAIAAAYVRRGFQPLWRDGERWRVEAEAVMRRIGEADEDGLDLRAYPSPPLDHASVAKEFELSEAVVAYAAQAAGARIDPQRLSRLIGARPPLPEANAILSAVGAAGARAGDVLQDFNPPHAGYRALRTKLAELRASRMADDDLRFAEARIAAARDDRSPPGGRRHSALPLNRSTGHVEAEIIANMERWRWLPRDLGNTRIEVNIPDFELSVVRDGAVAHRARVIVGKEKTPTPVFSDRMRFIIVNPYWNVPPSILNKEMLPKYGGNLAAIEQSGFQVTYRHGQAFVRQRPGERNALGRIKFMFPNNFSVYLHDTPSRGLFAAARRAFSHGCVRVDQPFRLAEVVLGPGSGWPEERVRRLIGGSERYINLAEPLPIHIEYFTARVDESGRLQLRDDLYGYSARVRAALGLDG